MPTAFATSLWFAAIFVRTAELLVSIDEENTPSFDWCVSKEVVGVD